MRGIKDLGPRRRDPVATPFVDACFMGWVTGVTREPGPLGLQVNRDGVVAIDDLAELRQMGKESAAKRPIHRMAGSHGVGVVIYESTGGTPYRLDEIIRAEIAWRVRDPMAIAILHNREKKLPYTKDAIAACLDEETDAIARATALIEGLELLVRETEFGDLCKPGKPYRRPWVLLEGGLHLDSRCVAEVLRVYGFPTAAIENCWLPNHFILSPETGACVNRFGLMYDRARGRAIDVNAIRDTIETAKEHRAPKESIGWYCLAYPWKFGLGEMNVDPAAQRAADEAVSACKHLVLGQVPYDASITMDAPGCDVIGIMQRMGAFAGDGVIYRPHPMEEESLLTGLTSSDLFRNWCEVHGVEHRVIDGAQLPLDSQLNRLDPDHHTVVTANSQAGLEAALGHRVVTFGRAWYDAAEITTKTMDGFVVPQPDRMARWASFVRWCLQKLYVRKEEVCRTMLETRISDWNEQGFTYFDPDEDY